ncbi:Nucleotidyltransferase domain protein [Candidatus Omnitrophus magneticus]|uniref:Nucleotidyltransferase domain protein n=1 Tax=Candidatus Omnitrophus magneticus TaxID=1609969 RepID=A0A0F0CRN4_9BACT|nr:Nucleotidyltransferase domain protein [Candidatus Omnitrophus magneticus]
MVFKNIDNLPKDIHNVLIPYLEKLTHIYGDNIISIFLYGSAATREYNPKYSDINIAIVVKDSSIRELKSGVKIIKDGMRKKISVPLFLTYSYIEMSLDTFPMEFMMMKDSYILLFGQDLLADININFENLRRECEYQIKGKLIMLRQAYLEAAMNYKALKQLIALSIKALLPIFQNLLRIKKGVLPRLDKIGVLNEIGIEFNMDVSCFIEAFNGIKTNSFSKTPEVFIECFLTRLEILSKIVDEI